MSTSGVTAAFASEVDESIADHIAGTMRLIMTRLVGPDTRRAAIAHTRLVVAFDFVFGETGDGKVSSLSARSLAIVKKVRARAIGGGAGWSEMKEMENLQIEARVWGDMPACEIGF
jgi:hypothetical protein